MKYNRILKIGIFFICIICFLQTNVSAKIMLEEEFVKQSDIHIETLVSATNPEEEIERKTPQVNFTPDDIANSADNFLNIGKQQQTDNGWNTQLDYTSDTIYNILLAICMVLAVVIGMILGIKYMIATTEEKAQIKETLIPYVIACFITFGAFTIWKIVINIIQT